MFWSRTHIYLWNRLVWKFLKRLYRFVFVSPITPASQFSFRQLVCQVEFQYNKCIIKGIVFTDGWINWQTFVYLGLHDIMKDLIKVHELRAREVCGYTMFSFLREWWWPWKGPTHARRLNKFVLIVFSLHPEDDKYKLFETVKHEWALFRATITLSRKNTCV